MESVSFVIIHILCIRKYSENGSTGIPPTVKEIHGLKKIQKPSLASLRAVPPKLRRVGSPQGLCQPDLSNWSEFGGAGRRPAERALAEDAGWEGGCLKPFSVPPLQDPCPPRGSPLSGPRTGLYAVVTVTAFAVTNSHLQIPHFWCEPQCFQWIYCKCIT